MTRSRMKPVPEEILAPRQSIMMARLKSGRITSSPTLMQKTLKSRICCCRPVGRMRNRQAYLALPWAATASMAF